MRVALIIIFNHRFDSNIAILAEIYGKRFSQIYFLMPFYDGDRKDVIPVYYNSRYFQSAISQSYPFIRHTEVDHYLYLADDCILNPEINEQNYMEYFNLDKETSFIPQLTQFHETREFWNRTHEAYEFRVDPPGLQIASELPELNVAIDRMRRFNLEMKALSYSQIWGPLSVSLNTFSSLRSAYAAGLRCARRVVHFITARTYHLSYPLVGSYSDLFIISKRSFYLFQRYCGVFAAAGLFAEIAIPTAMCLTSAKIVEEKNLQLQGKALWTSDDFVTIKLEQYESSLSRLIERFPRLLYLHPIKLSKWKLEC
jgi:hypothetical protein